MGIFDFLMGPDIDQGIEEYHATQGAVLLDVRTPEEYRQGHIPGSKNIPLYVINKAEEVISLDTPLFVYCHSGARSREAVSMLERMGYTRAKNIGGITAYKGEVEREDEGRYRRGRSGRSHRCGSYPPVGRAGGNRGL